MFAYSPSTLLSTQVCWNGLLSSFFGDSFDGVAAFFAAGFFGAAGLAAGVGAATALTLTPF